MPPADGPATPGAEELVQLKIELPKPTKEARLLNVGDLSTADDYPSEAIDREEEGRANAWLLVGTDGRVERCGIAITSGSSSLDARSCAILTARARFEPASDARGKAIRSLFYMPMTWKLVDTTDTPDKLAAEAQAIKLLRPELSKPASDAKLLNASELASAMDYPEESLVKEEEGTVYALILVGTEGLVERCGIERSSGSLALDAQTCSLIIAKARFEPARDRRGRSIQSLFHQRLTWRLQGRASPTPKDEIHRLTIVVGPANQIRSCKSEFIANERLVENPNFYCENYLRNGGGMLAAARQKSKLEEAVVVIENWFAITQNLQIPAVGHPVRRSARGAAFRVGQLFC